MLGLRVIAVGKIKNRAIDALCSDFQKRLSRYAKLELSEVKDVRESDVLVCRAREAERITEQLARGRAHSGRLIALSEEGDAMSSVALSNWLQATARAGCSRHTFLIGGPSGLEPALVERADRVLSLSPMTFTHEMARAILLEQLYRALTIWRGEPYHRR